LRRYWSLFLLAVVAWGTAGIAWVLIMPLADNTPPAARYLSISLRSSLRADYAADRQSVPVAGANLQLIADTIRDDEPEIDPDRLEQRMNNLLNQMQTPVLNVGPATSTPSPQPTTTATATTPATATPTATQPPTSTATPTATARPSSTPNPTATSTPTLTSTATNTAEPVPVLPTSTPTPTAVAEERWIGRLVDNTAAPGGWQGIIRVWVIGREGLPVTVFEVDSVWQTEALTGSKTDYGPYAIEIAPLTPGRYTIVPQGLGTSLTVEVESGHTVEVLFAREADLP
jgi:hypothetical protein